MIKPTTLGYLALATPIAMALTVVTVNTWKAVNRDIEHYEDLSSALVDPSSQSKAPETGPGWRTTQATFYGQPYDDGGRRVCADGKTVYRSDGLFCATRLVPLGTMIEVRRGDVTLRLRVADTQAPKFGHLLDLPSKTWDRLGSPRKVGKVAVEWRVAK